MHSWWKIMLIYIAGVMAGSLIASVAYPMFYLCGASTGMYALLTAHFANALFNSQMRFSCIKVLGFNLFALYSLKNSVIGTYYANYTYR